MCVCIWIYICMVSMRVCIYLCMYVFMCAFIYVHKYPCVCMHLYVYKCKFTWMQGLLTGKNTNLQNLTHLTKIEHKTIFECLLFLDFWKWKTWLVAESTNTNMYKYVFNFWFWILWNESSWGETSKTNMFEYFNVSLTVHVCSMYVCIYVCVCMYICT